MVLYSTSLFPLAWRAPGEDFFKGFFATGLRYGGAVRRLREGVAVRCCGTALRYGVAAGQMMFYSTSLSRFAWRAAGEECF